MAFAVLDGGGGRGVRGVLNAALVAEAIRTAQHLTGKKQVDGADVRRGFESLNITDARWKELGLMRAFVKDATGQALGYFIGLTLLLRCPAR